MKKYRIRVGKTSFADPHYVTNVGKSLNFTSLFVNKNPCSWKKHATAMKHLNRVKESFPSAEIEEYEPE
jgi:hypothetical protein